MRCGTRARNNPAMSASAVTISLFTSNDEPRPTLTLLRDDDHAPETVRFAVAEGHRLCEREAESS
jgi:hypothetical protein